MDKNKISKFIQDKEYKNIARHVEKTLIHKNFIKQNKKSTKTVRYLYDILKDIGYMKMQNYGLNESLINEIKPLFSLPIDFKNNSVPTLFSFDELFNELDLYTHLTNNIKTTPEAGKKPDEEEKWEDRWRDLKNSALQLVFSGFDITAVKQGWKLISNNTTFSKEWDSSWQLFSDNADKYIKELCSLKEEMAFISDRIHKEMSKYNMPDDIFFNTVSEIVNIKENWAEQNHFRYILSSQQVNEFYEISKYKFKNFSSAAQIYFFKNALAETALKHFIYKGCLSLLTKDFTDKNWTLMSTLDDDEPVQEKTTVIPMVSVGNGARQEIYSVHMLGPKVSGWGMLKERLKLLFLDDKAYKGAFFCSWKEYPTEEILVRFDRFIPKSRFKKLIKNKENFVRLSVDTVLQEKDLRQKIILEVAKVVVGLEEQPDSVLESVATQEEQYNFKNNLKKIFFAPEQILDYFVNCLQNLCPDISKSGGQQVFAPQVAQVTAMSRETEGSYYMPVASLKETSYLNPDPDNKFSNAIISDAINSSLENDWQYIWLFFGKNGKVINEEIFGPKEIDGDGERLLDIPDNAECVLFLIGKEETMTNIRVTYNKKKSFQLTGKEKLYCIIYGSEK